jgi:maltose phosphorylase
VSLCVFVSLEYPSDHKRITESITDAELQSWKKSSDAMYFPFSEEHNLLAARWFLRQGIGSRSDLDKPKTNQSKWSWDSLISNKPMFYMFLLLRRSFFEEELKNNNFTNRSPFMKAHFRLVALYSSPLLDKMDMAYVLFKNFTFRS